MKTLIVYYSFEGNTEFVANLIAQETHADILRLEPVDEKAPQGFMKYFWGGKQVFTKAKPELKPFDTNPMEYDLIVIGTPVWANTHAPALRTFLDKQDICGKKIALFCCCQGGFPGSTFKDIINMIPDNKLISRLIFKDPLRRNKEANAQKVREWIKEFS